MEHVCFVRGLLAKAVDAHEEVPQQRALVVRRQQLDDNCLLGIFLLILGGNVAADFVHARPDADDFPPERERDRERESNKE